MVGAKNVEPTGLIHVGTVAKPHGIRGEVKIFCLSGQPENFRDYPALVLIAEDGERCDYTVSSLRVQGKFVVVALAGVIDRNRAEELYGSQVWVDQEYLAPLADDEFYWHDVMGAEVVDVQGNVIGNLISLMTTGGGELLVVRKDSDEVLIPSRPEFLVEIGADRIIVDLPPGLLDINRAK
ncbi:MAG: ribosome maturation factor RimM [Proteobacteria bacterium]|nr:ribosome maturation factor RimM [Pseudomonadota bacterium]MBU1639939.1 ribosome maturation factor RimM [Pseudomonadota bacterium]